MKRLFLILLFSILGLNVSAQEIKTLSGKVIAITDGDTFKLLTQDSTQIKIRVANIDCPEKKQPFYQKAKQFTSEAIFSKNVTLKILKNDRYGRFVAEVIYNDSLELGHQLVKNGYAWHFIKYSNDPQLTTLENQAREKKLGLWSDPEAIAPWEWRSRKKQKASKE